MPKVAQCNAWCQGLCWKHARDKGLEEPKRKKKVCAEQATKKGLKGPRKPMNNHKKKVQPKKERRSQVRVKKKMKVQNLYPGSWSDAVEMTGHHKKAKSQVE